METSTCQVEQLEHTAEIGLRVHAPTLETLFACVAEGMFALLEARPDRADHPVEQQVAVESIDMPSLMVDWLNELLYLHESAHLIFTGYDVTLHSETRLEALVVGFPLATLPSMHIKAVTYHQLRIEERANGCKAEVYFDI